MEEWVTGFNIFLKGDIEQHVFYHTDKIALKSEKLEIISRPNNQTPNIWISQSGEESDLREFCFYIYDLNGDGYISRHLDWIATTNYNIKYEFILEKNH